MCSSDLTMSNSDVTRLIVDTLKSGPVDILPPLLEKVPVFVYRQSSQKDSSPHPFLSPQSKLLIHDPVKTVQ